MTHESLSRAFIAHFYITHKNSQHVSFGHSFPDSVGMSCFCVRFHFLKLYCVPRPCGINIRGDPLSNSYNNRKMMNKDTINGMTVKLSLGKVISADFIRISSFFVWFCLVYGSFIRARHIPYIEGIRIKYHLKAIHFVSIIHYAKK